MLITITDSDITGGIRNDPCRCPVALAVERVTGHRCRVGLSVAVLYADTLRHKDVWLSPCVGEFVRRFDAGKPVGPIAFELQTDPVLTSG